MNEGRGNRVGDAERILETARTVLVVDWPTRDVPDTLAAAGFTVVVHGGPGPEAYAAYECSEMGGNRAVVRHLGAPPEHADLVYAHRPFAELPGIIAIAQALGATTIWAQSGQTALGTNDPAGCWVPDDQSRAAREMVESANLTYIEKPYIADAVRQYKANVQKPPR